MKEGLFEDDQFIGVSKANNIETRIMMDKFSLRGTKLIEKIKWNDYIIKKDEDIWNEDEDDLDSRTSSSHDSS